MAWHLAPSLSVLRAEINGRWPNRDKASDGTIGDQSHTESTSDHNPNSRDSVNAIDIDKDGVDVAAIIAAAEAHPSVHYWIYNRQIADRDNGFRRQKYSGPNPHDKHVHISIRQSRAAEDDTRPWGLEVLSTADKTWLTSLVKAETAAVKSETNYLKTLVREQPAATMSVTYGRDENRRTVGELIVEARNAASAAVGIAGDIDTQMDTYAAADATRDAELPARVREALGAGQTPEQVAALLLQVPGVDWPAVAVLLAV